MASVKRLKKTEPKLFISVFAYLQFELGGSICYMTKVFSALFFNLYRFFSLVFY